MGDRLQVGKPYRYVTSHPGKLSLTIPPWVGEMSTSLGWEGNRRSGDALAMRHKQFIYGLNGLCKKDEHPEYTPKEYSRPFTTIAFAL